MMCTSNSWSRFKGILKIPILKKFILLVYIIMQIWIDHLVLVQSSCSSVLHKAWLRVTRNYILTGDVYTNVSESHGTTSWLDHCTCICTSSLAFNTSTVIDFKVLHDVVCSNHMPLLFTLNCSYVPVLSDATNSDSVHKCFDWNKLDKDGILTIQVSCLVELLSRVEVPSEPYRCTL